MPMSVDIKDTNGNPVMAGHVACTDLSKRVVAYAENGGDANLCVDGSSTPVIFTYDADPTDNIALFGLRFLGSAADFVMEGSKFGNKGALTNGLLVEAKTGGAASFVTLATIKYNEQFFEFGSYCATKIYALSRDLLVAELVLCGSTLLNGGSSDQIKVTVQDNLTAQNVYRLSLMVYGVKV